jgi:small subunit ribosomal protein S10
MYFGMPTTKVTKEKKEKAPTKEKVAEKKVAAKKAPAKAKVVKAPKEEVVSKLRIRVRAYEYKILDVSVKQIIDTALRYDAKILGPIPLPTEIKKYTVNRSAFIYKNAREQFEMRVHKRLIDILNPTPKIMEALTNLSLPSGVNIDVKII